MSEIRRGDVHLHGVGTTWLLVLSNGMYNFAGLAIVAPVTSDSTSGCTVPLASLSYPIYAVIDALKQIPVTELGPKILSLDTAHRAELDRSLTRLLLADDLETL
jgi:hypothetical protein